MNALIAQPCYDLLDRAREVLARIDDYRYPATFRDRLRKKYEWEDEFINRVEPEYHRFICLSLVLEDNAVPSPFIDDWWHAHLLYTRSYWLDFCERLGSPVHHEPGGEREWLLNKYDSMLRAYEKVFGEEAPHDVWPRRQATSCHECCVVGCND